MREIMLIKTVKYLHDYTLELTFKNGQHRKIDYAKLLNKNRPMMKPLFNIAYFKKVRVDEYGGLVWPNGWDACPDYLYEIGE